MNAEFRIYGGDMNTLKYVHDISDDIASISSNTIKRYKKTFASCSISNFFGIGFRISCKTSRK